MGRVRQLRRRLGTFFDERKAMWRNKVAMLEKGGERKRGQELTQEPPEPSSASSKALR